MTGTIPLVDRVGVLLQRSDDRIRVTLVDRPDYRMGDHVNSIKLTRWRAIRLGLSAIRLAVKP